MSVSPTTTGGVPAERAPDTVSAVIDGVEVVVPKGTLIIRAAEQIGIQIPRFCDHPLLDPLGACRQCIVEVEGQRKPLTACTTTLTDGMVVRTQLSSEVAAKAQAGTLEMLLINHPLDCPVCDKGGECPLQNQSLTNGYAVSRFHDRKRTFVKPIAISAQVLLDRERCVLCARCTRFSQQIAGDPFIELFERGALEQVAIYEDEPFESYFSGNTVQICPVGALTGAQYRFRARPFDLVSTPSVCEHCASGCQQRTDWRRGTVLRRLAGQDESVNEEWNCDKGRWAFSYAFAPDRLTRPLVRDANGYQQPASWSDALAAAAQRLRDAGPRVGVLTGGRLTYEDAYAYSRFARSVLGTNDIDFRARPHSVEEQEFLAAEVAGRELGVTYADLEQAPAVLLVALEPEEESPILFLRLRKAARTRGLPVYAVATGTSRGLAKCSARVLRAVPGEEAGLLAGLGGATEGAAADLAGALRRPGAVILVGERAATLPGLLSTVSRLAADTGARIGWVPRRAGDRGALDAGCLPNLLPGGRPAADVAAQADVAALWGELPAAPGRNLDQVLQAVLDGELDALIVAGVDPDDTADPARFRAALAEVPLVVSLELRSSPVTEVADVVLPVAPAVHKDGTYLDWEGRRRPFAQTFELTGAMPDHRVLHALAEELGHDLGCATVEAVRAQVDQLRGWDGPRGSAPAVPAGVTPPPGPGEAVLATWHRLLDDGRMQHPEPHLAATAPEPTALVSAATAAELGVAAGELLQVSTEHGAVSLPLAVAELPERVVWLPTFSPGSHVHAQLRAVHGQRVRLAAAGRGGR